MIKIKDITGQVFGELTAVKLAGRDKHQQAIWECLCSCGKSPIVSGANLRSGHTKSCGHAPTHCPQGHEYTEENTRVYKNTRVCRVCSSGNSKECYERNKREGIVFPSHTKEAKRRAALKPLGWTPELFDKTWEEQGGKCSICPSILNMDMVQNAARACADHEHVEPPRPRGILCSVCNAMLGMAKDNPDTLRAGAEYLEKFLLEIPAEETQHLIVST